MLIFCVAVDRLSLIIGSFSMMMVLILYLFPYLNYPTYFLGMSFAYHNKVHLLWLLSFSFNPECNLSLKKKINEWKCYRYYKVNFYFIFRNVMYQDIFNDCFTCTTQSMYSYVVLTDILAVSHSMFHFATYKMEHFKEILISHTSSPHTIPLFYF